MLGSCLLPGSLLSTLRAWTSPAQRFPGKPAPMAIGPHDHNAFLVSHHDAVWLAFLFIIGHGYFQELARHHAPPYQCSDTTYSFQPFSR